MLLLTRPTIYIFQKGVGNGCTGILLLDLLLLNTSHQLELDSSLEVILISRLKGGIKYAAFLQKLQDVHVQVPSLEISQPPAPPVNHYQLK